MKVCSECKIEKENSEFHKQLTGFLGLNSKCKICRKKWQEHHYQVNSEKCKKQTQKYRQINNKKIKEKRQIKKNENNLKKRFKRRLDIENKRKRDSNYFKNRLSSNSFFKLRHNIVNSINRSIRVRGYSKNSNTEQILGCSYENLHLYLGPKPEGDYHLDHICPCAQAQNEEELIKLQHYTNLRWLSAEENLSKNNKITIEGEDMCRILLCREWIN